ncbi:TetR/AcrR family transcriptional regulator [Herbiconiux sp. P17]|uniref:TetR/AcrR family transcriptional regulator n=1 Tax=Herbiconiux wuyangfengii TaxID=3342794 RepID=UPI0035BA7E6E
MPRHADHEQRRRQITDAARTVIAERGLPATTFESVSTTAGCSARLLQYYFGSKEELLRAARQAVLADAGRRFEASLAGLAETPTPPEAIRQVLLQRLPGTPAEVQDARVLAEFHDRAVTDASAASSGAAAALSALIVGLLQRDPASAGADPVDTARTATTDAADAAGAALRADLAVAATGGVVQGVLSREHDHAHAVRLIDLLVDRLFGP